MRIMRLFPLLLIGLMALGLLTFSVASRAAAQGQNLLTNPSFEGPYASYTPETPQEQADCPHGFCNTAQMPAGWKPWWVKERPTDVNPEFKPATTTVAGNRVRTGERAAQYFSFWSTHKAGLRQTVTVPAGSTVQFTVWGQAWLTEEDNSTTSDFSGTANMQIGIDPTGGTNPFNPAVVWSGFQQPLDSYQPFSVQARAQGDQVTVFTFAAPGVNPNSSDYGFKHTDIYWDDASLVAIGGGAPPPPPPPPPTNSGGGEPALPAAAAPVTQSGLGPTATPDADGVIYAEVLSGDSIWAVAARAGLTLEEILELNDMTGDDFVHTGDLLIVGFADPSGTEEETAEPTEEQSAESAVEEATLEPTNTPEPVAEAAEEESEPQVAICLTAYDDANQNGVRDSGEELRPAVAISISDGQSVVSNYVTDGTAEPFCVEGLNAGNYRVSRSSLENEILTTPGDRAVALTGGSSLNLYFGSYLIEETLAMVSADEGEENLESAAETTVAEEAQSLDTMTIIIGVALIVAIVLIAALVIMILKGRRATT